MARAGSRWRPTPTQIWNEAKREMSDTINKLTIEGFKSIRKLEDFELRPLSVLIGANGAGKSNFVEFLRLLRELVEQRLQVFIGTPGGGGADTFLYLGPKITKQIHGKVQFSGDFSYEFSLKPTMDGQLLFVDEAVLLPETIAFAEGMNEPAVSPAETVSFGSGHAEAKLKDNPTAYPGSGLRRRFEWVKLAGESPPRRAYKALSELGVYHFHDTSPTAGVRRPIALNQTGSLYPEGSNLAAFLNRIMYEDMATYMKIRDVVRLAAPFFSDFQLHPMHVNSALIQLEWTQKDSDYRFLASHLSDGTLRFICLATALLQPSPPATMVFDEPELGLHPSALTLLGALFKQASMRTSQQVLVSTQSAPLLDEFLPEDVVVVERHEGESTFRRLEAPKLSEWLEEYSLGQLWQKNVLGGRPKSDQTPEPVAADGSSNGGS